MSYCEVVQSYRLLPWRQGVCGSIKLRSYTIELFCLSGVNDGAIKGALIVVFDPIASVVSPSTTS